MLKKSATCAALALTLGGYAGAAQAQAAHTWWMINQDAATCEKMADVFHGAIINPLQDEAWMRSHGAIINKIHVYPGYLPGGEVVEIQATPPAEIGSPGYWTFYSAWGDCEATLQQNEKDGNIADPSKLQ